MKKGNTLLIVGGVLAIGAVGFFLYKRFMKKAEENLDKTLKAPEEPTPQTSEEKPQLPVLPVGGVLGGIGTWLTPYLTTYNPYTVNTVSSSLYIRETPDAKGKILGKYAKGAVINAKPSKTKGWFEVTDDGKTVKGYVSSVYLKAQPLKK
jgi:hypothetical protein